MTACHDDPSRFNETILCRNSYWHKQEEICRSVVKYPITCVKTGNGVGKSFLEGGIVPWFATLRPGSKTVVAAPSQAQLAGVLWSEIQAACKSAEEHGRYLGGRFSGLTWELGENWRVEGFGHGSVESKSGRHAPELLAIIDEASGVHRDVHEAIDSLNPSRRLYCGNPLRPEGKFFDLCELSKDNPHVNVIQISSLESPHIGLERSPWGMADRTWIENARYEYGEDSIWWLCHVLGRFPTELDQALLPIPWLDAAGRLVHLRGGRVRLGVDLAKGAGGDDSCIVARDDNGVLGSWASNRWSLEESARQVKLRAAEYNVDGPRITYDASGVGVDFANRLAAVGLFGAKDYLGSRDGGEKFANLRSACGWQLRRRLDPGRTKRGEESGLYLPQVPFSIPADLLRRYRLELQGVRYQLDDAGRIELERKDDFVKRIKRSPNFLDSLMMTFAFPNA
jgi:phage terminase large subunit